jgi:hypothetical protein
MTCFNSAGISGIGSRRTFIEPSAAFLHDDVDLAAGGVLVRKILAEMAAAAFLAVNRPSA